MTFLIGRTVKPLVSWFKSSVNYALKMNKQIKNQSHTVYITFTYIHSILYFWLNGLYVKINYSSFYLMLCTSLLSLTKNCYLYNSNTLIIVHFVKLNL